MYKTYLVLWILLVSLSAQAQQTPIAGTWRLDLSETIELMDIAIKQNFESLDQSAKTRIQTSMAGRTFLFHEGVNLTVNWKFQDNPKISTGTWDVSGETLTMTIEGDVQRFIFNITTGSHLVLRSTIPSGFLVTFI